MPFPRNILVVTELLFVSLLSAQTIPVLESSNLPIVIIDTHGQTIKDQSRITADMGVINNTGMRNNITDPFNDYDGKIAIELRGSSSSGYPKKQYRFETVDNLGNNLNTKLMGLPKENDWIFYGPYDDRSLIRNALAFHLSNAIGRYASRTRFCEIVLNDEYQGLYVLMEKVKRDNDRVDIAELDEDDLSADSLTGGYIIKIDKIEGENVGSWYSAFGTVYQYHYPKNDEIKNEQKDYIKTYMNTFEIAMNNQGWNNPASGYSAYIDVESFIDHFILSEVAKNVDAYRLSSYLYKDRDKNNGKLHAGPIWDFNLSFGKAWYPEDLFLTGGWQIHYSIRRPSDSYKVPFWWVKLPTDPAFEAVLVNRWKELRQGVLSEDYIYSVIDSLVEYTAEARTRNFQVWPAPNQGYTFEIMELKSWINARITWIENNIQFLASLDSKTGNQPSDFLLLQNYPNPFNPETTIEFQLAKKAYVQIKIYSSDGKEIRILLNETQIPGMHKIKWDGKNNDNNPVNSGIYFYKLIVDDRAVSKKMLLLK